MERKISRPSHEGAASSHYASHRGGTRRQRRRTTGIATPKQLCLLPSLSLSEPRLSKHPVLEYPIPRNLGDDTSRRDNRKEGVGFRSDGEGNGGEEGGELGLVVEGGSDSVDVGL